MVLGRAGRWVRVDKAAQDEVLRLCVASAAASCRVPAAPWGRGGDTADPDRLLRELGFEPPTRGDRSGLAELPGFAPRS